MARETKERTLNAFGDRSGLPCQGGYAKNTIRCEIMGGYIEKTRENRRLAGKRITEITKEGSKGLYEKRRGTTKSTGKGTGGRRQGSPKAGTDSRLYETNTESSASEKAKPSSEKALEQ